MIFQKIKRNRRVLCLRVHVNKFYNIYFKFNGRSTDSKPFYHLSKFRIFLEFFEKFFLLVCWTDDVYGLTFDDFLEFSNCCCSIFSFFNFHGFFSLLSCRSLLIIESSSSFFISFFDFLVLFLVPGMLSKLCI